MVREQLKNSSLVETGVPMVTCGIPFTFERKIVDARSFNNLVECQLKLCSDILTKKDKEYSSPQDRLHNFKRAAVLQGISPREALRGMMAKHTVSIYDMCQSCEHYPMEVWDEKITDSINYLILLKGIIEDEKIDSLVDQANVVVEGSEARRLLEIWGNDKK